MKAARRALMALALVASCNRPATQIVLRVDSDLRPGVELQGVVVTLRREGATTPSFEQSYDLTAGTLTLPGTVGVVPGDPDDARRLEVEARARLPGGDGFSTYATVSFQREQTLFLELFLASRCRDPQNRAGCGPDETCGPSGCEPIVRAMLPGFSADVPRREVSTPEPADAPDVPEPLDAPDVPEPSDIVDAPAPPDAPDVPEPSDIVDAPDVVLPTCGGQGQACCPGSERCTDGGVCYVAVCTFCGTPGQPCCPMDQCVSGARCATGVCAPCGGDGQPCCAGNACTVGACVGGVCGGCGARGQRCCANSVCDAGSACAAGTCVACGGRGQPCCAGNACGNGNTCSAGSCVACGGNGQPCCLNNACDATGNLCVTASCTGGTCRHAVSPDGTQAGLGPSLRCCGGTLVDTATNPSHCGNPCVTASCTAARAVTPSRPTAHRRGSAPRCDAAAALLVDTATNPSHCGGCNMGCATGICEAASAIPCGGGGFTGGVVAPARTRSARWGRADGDRCAAGRRPTTTAARRRTRAPAGRARPSSTSRAARTTAGSDPGSTSATRGFSATHPGP
ncbi:MAG: hypothetical protein U0325_33255 [Polyangiales bacterium]